MLFEGFASDLDLPPLARKAAAVPQSVPTPAAAVVDISAVDRKRQMQNQFMGMKSEEEKLNRQNNR